ncbi:MULTISPECIES: gliding motility-associated C-terminal domain-containing protein [unclassified Tenacibaculum]|uniref:T9SS type B sorting domain-containing protein n=1 Tax=unclassified Tenacibaculum TaxID=2635139 RepID=UPI001F2BC553|nr:MULTISPECIES: gliding motility-associated C-terminal domain-containing protein [unclassified Tenacibaculum]MCF2876340.1 gliding motility-associated C-terminal domain-containing protein [Tenacibaculum sp. Cn5-1]MCF2936517.1 gliding motility-associated C-terminal domain-containing protein [Tenacibaculum sp. Cn5-34]MCG7512758.1 gliding motility-associated C-terminal domain-containing protein [Tenacibaculum sp. Cn5-46]
MNKITRSIQILLGVFLFCIHYTTVAQTLNPPVLQFGASACDDNPAGPKDFLIDLSFTTTAFNNDNQFIIELSDADGNFGSPITLRTLNDPTLNTAFNIPNVSFQLPAGTFGKNYRIRVRTTSPVMTAVSATSFEAYYNQQTTGSLTVTNADGKDDFTLCSGGSTELMLNVTTTGVYSWYRLVGGVETLLATTNDPKFTISEPGNYFVRIDYGACGNVESIHAIVSGISTADAQIANVSAVEEICSTKDYELKASINNSSYTYKWYYNGVEKQSSNSNTYTIPTEGQFGKYRLDIDTGDCTTTSNEIELKQKTTPSFSVTTVNAGESVMLPCETKKAEVTGAPSGATIQWYRNDVALTGQTLFEFNITSPGEYYAIVTDPSSSSSCPATVKSETYSVFTLKEFKVDIRIQDTNYTECESTSAKLVIVGVKALVNENANEYDLTDDQLNETSPVLIQYQWHKDGTPITTGGTGKELDINSYLDNGEYELEVKSCVLGTQNGMSAKTSVKLAAPLPTITSVPNSNSLCPGATITYSLGGGLLPGFTYEWFKDGGTTAVATNVVDFDVDSIGEYVLKMTGFGCERSIDPINVVLFDESVVEVTPSVKVVLNQGQTVTVTASGGESYVWHEGQDDTGTVLSTNETLDVNALGFYTVVVSVGSCRVVKTIEVVEQDDQIIVPNIVTPNQDGINDTWQISNRYAFQPTVTIQLYNSNGKEILNTTDYQNNWPTESLGNQRVFYYKIIRDDVLIKAGTISVLD